MSIYTSIDISATQYTVISDITSTPSLPIGLFSALRPTQVLNDHFGICFVQLQVLLMTLVLTEICFRASHMTKCNRVEIALN